MKLLWSLLCLTLSALAAEPAAYQAQVGDILFQSLPHHPVVDCIEGSTRSPYSHCGIVVQGKSGLLVLEAIGPVMETPLNEWILRGRDQKYSAHRLNEHAAKLPEILKAARTMLGKPYDIQYEMDDAKIYCSELIYKAFKEVTGESLGMTQLLEELNWKPYTAIIQQIAGGEVPLKREMITPASLAKAKQLTLVKGFDSGNARPKSLSLRHRER